MTSHETGTGPASGRLKGKVALVTGASKRIGRAIAIALAEEGVNIVAHDRRNQEPEMNKVCDEVVGCGSKSWKVMADMEKPEEYGTLVERAAQAAGAIDFLINNASIFLPATLADMTLEDITRHLHVNAWAPFVLIRDFARQVKRGKVVNLLDTKIVGYDREHVPYIMSKHLLALLTKMCALEFAPALAVNAVAPGLILPPAGKGDDYLDRLAPRLPLQRHGSPADIADAVLYLLKSDFVTGQVIYVDGGRHLREDGNGPDTDQ